VNDFQPILNRYKLRHIETLRVPDGGLIRSWVILCENKNGKKLILKIFSSDDDYARKRFIDEIRNVTLVRDSFSLSNRRLLPKIRYKKISDRGELYYIYDYFAGIQVGDFESDFGISLGIFNKENFPVFLKSLTAIADIKLKDKNKIERVYLLDRVQKELNVYEPIYRSYFSATEGKGNVSSFLYSIAGTVFKDENMVTCQTDLYPANIFANRSGGKTFRFLDWEYLSHAPIGFLPAFLYLSFWKEDFWRSKIYSHFYDYFVNKRGFSEDVFNKSFRFCIVILGLRFWYQSHSIFAKGRLEERRLSSMTTFSYFIGAAIEGGIVKPTNIKFYINLGDLQKVADEYNLGKVIKYEVFYSGRGNTVSMVETEDGRKYIFRFYYKTRSLRMIKNELSLYDKLSSNGVCTYKVFKSSKGELFINIKLYGRYRRVAVLSYLEGGRISRRWDSQKTVKSLAKTLSSIHKLGIVHNDFSKENVLFVKGKLTGVIDFEWGRFTTKQFMYENDLARAIVLWLIDVRGKTVSGDDFIKWFLMGYYDGKLPEKKKLERILFKVEKELRNEKKIAEEIFYKNSSDSTRKRGIRRFIYANSDIDKFRKAYIG